MALKKCKECGKEISTKAIKCPHCGAPVRRQFKLGCGSFILILIALGFMMSLFDSDPVKEGSSDKKASSTSIQSKPRETVSNSAWDGSVRQVERYLKDNLVDPGSFDDIEWSAVQKVDLPTHKYFVRCKYRAKNSFGGYVISNQIFYLDSQGNVVNVMNYGQ